MRRESHIYGMLDASSASVDDMLAVDRLKCSAQEAGQFAVLDAAFAEDPATDKQESYVER